MPARCTASTRASSLPEIDDGLDEIAANQRAIALLQRIQDDDPDLWRTITALPDGIRSALQLRSTNAANERHAQNTLAIEGSQTPLISPSTLEAIPSPFDDPREGETLVLLGAAGASGCYAVGSDLKPRPISPAQFIAAAECSPDTPAQPLPEGTNERVMGGVRRVPERLSKTAGQGQKDAGHQGPPLRVAGNSASLCARPTRAIRSSSGSKCSGESSWARCPSK